MVSYVLPTITSENDFSRLRCLLLDRPTIPEHQIASRIAKAIKDNPNDQVDNPLVTARLNTPSKFDTNLIIHYTYENRLQGNEANTHRLWNQTFKQTPVLMSNRNSRNMTKELVHLRPRL